MDRSYDARHRLTDANAAMFGGDHWHRFTYDALDNLRSWKLGGVKDYANYVYDASNRLTSIKNTGGSTLHTLSYDVQGNVTAKDTASYTFDFGNRLRLGTGPGGSEGYRYDGHGRRALAWVPAGATLSFYAFNGQLLYQHSTPKARALDHVYLAGSLVAIREVPFAGGSVVKYQHTDALGGPVAISNAAGTVTERTNYDPYGGAINKTIDGVGYTGHVMDPVTGLTYMQQRYYDPTIGRFLSVDPIASDTTNGWNFNRYNYAANNPFRFTDPDGRQVSSNLNLPNSPEFRAADRYQNAEGELSVSGHGDNRGIWDDRSRVGRTPEGRDHLNPSEVVTHIQSLEGYAEAKQITLLNCNAGTGENSLAQQVADQTGKPVVAADSLVEGNPNNGQFVPFVDRSQNGQDPNHARDPGEQTEFKRYEPRVERTETTS